MENKITKSSMISRKRYVKRRQMHNRFKYVLNSINNESLSSDKEQVSLSSQNETESLITSQNESHTQTDDDQQNMINVSDISHQPEIQDQFNRDISVENIITIYNTRNHESLLNTANNDLKTMLQNWVFACHPQVSHVDLLLSGLNKFSFAKNIPKTYSTLMNTPKNIILRECSPGQYYHVGVKKSVTAAIKYYSPDHCDTIVLDINIDGLPLYKTTPTQLWPILGQIKNFRSNPFVIGIYIGKKKPTSAKCFLADFIAEMKILEIDGFIYNENVIKVRIRVFILDSPAKSFIKNVKGHNAYYGCPICIESGEYLKSRICYPELHSTLRTNNSFRLRIHEEHHLDDEVSSSPIEELNVDMINAFPPDSMHVIYIGVTKKLLTEWLSGMLSVRMSGFYQTEFSNMLKKIAKTQPRQFSRPSRSLDEIKYWRATEYRTFLLYTGPVILQNVLPPNLYFNFLLLHVATKLCTREEFLCQLDLAETLFEEFIVTFEINYSRHLISSNVHSLIHIVKFCRILGVIDDYSAFPHESTLGKMKRIIKKHKQELQQIAKRLEECMGLLAKSKTITDTHLLAENPQNSGMYCKLVSESFTLSNENKDGWFLTKTRKIVKITYFLKTNANFITIKGEELVSELSNIYEEPIDSMKLGMFKTNQLQFAESKIYQIDDIRSKLFYFSTSQEFFYFMTM